MPNGQLLSNARERHQFAKQCLESAMNLSERLNEARLPDTAPAHAAAQRQKCLDVAALLAADLRLWLDEEAERLS